MSDSDARVAATDPRLSVLLQAPAGSGKTTVLTQRLLRLLAQVDEPEEILAITFTRKAAAEMRARVLKALRGEVGNDAQGLRLRELADAALRQAALRGWNLVDDPARLAIQTIDSFNFRLASQLPVTAKAGGTLVIADRPQELYRRAARRTLTEAEGDAELAVDAGLLFERLDNNWRKVEQLLERMLQQRGHWLRYVLGHEPGALCARIGASLTNIVRDQLAAACECIAVGLRIEAAALPQVGPMHGDPEGLAAWKQLARLSMTQKGEWRKPKGVTRTLGPAYEAAEAKEALRACIERLSSVNGAREVLLELDALPGSELCADDTVAIEALSRLLRFAAAQLHAEFSTAGRVDHTYIGGAARAALSDAGLPTDLALRTGLALRHILVDEFQDTSLAQFDLIEALTAGWDEGDGRTLFVVGDPMQSIYQFREAEVGLFLRARDHGIGSVRLQPLQLTRNFRSVPALVEWTNDAFAGLFPARDDLRASAVSFTPSIAARSAPLESVSAAQAVQLRLFPGGDRAGEAAAVATQIVALRNAQPAATVAVLVASRAHAVPILAALEARDVEAIGVDLVPLGEISIVRDLVALLRALHHLGDRTAWLAVLRAPWCGVSLATLTAVSQRGDTQLIWEAIADPERLAHCCAADRRRLARLREVLSHALTFRTGAPLADWVELTWTRLGSADAYPKQALRHAHAFLAALSERSAAGEWNGPQDLDSVLADLFAQPHSSASNPVQIMTIHRAKGLEFDHVFLPGLDRDLGKAGQPLLRWLDLPRAYGQSDLIMAPVPVIGDEEGGEVGSYLKRLIAKRAANEQARLLYVAATRARETLFLSGAPKVKADGTVLRRSGTLLAALWPVFATGFETGAPLASPESAAPGTQPLRRLLADWSPPQLETLAELPHLPLARQSLEQDQELEFSWVQETSRSIGTVVHAALEGLGAESELPSPASVEASREQIGYQLRRHGVPDGDLQRATDIVVDALSRTLGDERGRWIFSLEHRQAQSELALTGIAAGRLTNVVIDRSFVDKEGTRWVIDFKTSGHQGGGLEAFLDREVERYEPQLKKYVELAAALGPEPVRAALYFPLLGEFRELG